MQELSPDLGDLDDLEGLKKLEGLKEQEAQWSTLEQCHPPTSSGSGVLDHVLQASEMCDPLQTCQLARSRQGV